MTNDDAKRALMSECPVIHRNIVYKCVSGIIYRKSKKGRVVLSLELTSKTAARSVTIAPANQVKEYIAENEYP